MKLKLTKTQKNYLEWFYKGNALQVNLECFSQIGEISYTSPITFNTDRRALDNLKRAGMLEFKDEMAFGLRFIMVTLSERGVEFMENQR